MTAAFVTAAAGNVSDAYDVDALLYDDVNSARTADLGFYGALARDKSSVLELACGTGRVILGVADARQRCIGVDSSAAMLARARSKRVEAGISPAAVRLVLGDMRTVMLGERFALCVCAYNSVQHLLTHADQLAFFATVRRHLGPRGVLAFDVYNPDFRFLQRARRRVHKATFDSAALGMSIALFENTAYDATTQVNTITYVYERASGPVGARPVCQVTFGMKQYFPRDLDALLDTAGFVIEQKLGTFDGASFDESHGSQIVICRPR